MTAQIGHNAPPPIEAHSLNIEELFSTVSDTLAGGPVTNDAQDAALSAIMDDMKQAKGAASDQCEAEYRPHKTAADGVKSAWKPVLARADAGIDALHRALSPYRIAKEAAREAEAKRLRDIAAAESAKAQEALAKADDLESEFHAQGQLATVAKMQAKANRIERTATGLRTSWDCEVHDYTAFAKWAWENRRDDCHEFFSSLAFKVVRELKRDLPGMKAIKGKKAV